MTFSSDVAAPAKAPITTPVSTRTSVWSTPRTAWDTAMTKATAPSPPAKAKP